MIETAETIRREVVVEVGQARAYELFTADMTSSMRCRRERRAMKDASDW